ncbi:hypothetical protein ABKN59_007673 [Abortiporus biennis]
MLEHSATSGAYPNKRGTFPHIFHISLCIVTMSGVPLTSSLPLDVLELIVDHLHDNHGSLKALSLCSHALLSRCRRHLRYVLEIRICGSKDVSNGVPSILPTLTFSTILQHLPELRKLTLYNLQLEGYPSDLQPLPNLLVVSFEHVVLEIYTKEIFQLLHSFTNVQVVEITEFDWLSAEISSSPASLPDIEEIYEPVLSLKSLFFGGYHMASVCPELIRWTRAKVVSTALKALDMVLLSTDYAEEIGDWFEEIGGHLEDLTLRISASIAVDHGTIERCFNDLRITNCCSLRSLKFIIPPPVDYTEYNPWTLLLNIVACIPAHSVRRICIGFADNFGDNDPQQLHLLHALVGLPWHSLDERLSGRDFRHLEEIAFTFEAELVYKSEPYKFAKIMPLLFSRNLMHGSSKFLSLMRRPRPWTFELSTPFTDFTLMVPFNYSIIFISFLLLEHKLVDVKVGHCIDKEACHIRSDGSKYFLTAFDFTNMRATEQSIFSVWRLGPTNINNAYFDPFLNTSAFADPPWPISLSTLLPLTIQPCLSFQITPQDVSADVMWLYRESREQEQWLADYSNYHAGFTDDNGLIGWNNGAAARNLWQPAPMPTFEMQAIAYHQDQNGTMQVDTSVQMLDDNVFAMPQALEAEETNHSFQLAPNFRKEEHDEAIGSVYSAVVLQPKNESLGVDADIVDEAIVEEMLFDFKGDDSVEEDSA